MKFGLFGGALATNATGVASYAGAADSQHYRHFIDYVCEADALGFYSAFVVEHHFTGIGQVSATLSLLSYLAARTERIRLGTGVTVMPWHNPVLLAEQIATLDLLSGGRADIGVGKGYRANEFKGFAIDPSEAAERYEEGLEVVLRSLTSTERFSHHGRYWHFDDIVVEPRSTQQPHPPIWIGASSEASIRGAAAKGFRLLLDQWASAEILMERVGFYAQDVVAAGRVFDPSHVAISRAVQVCRTDEEREHALEKRARILLTSGALAAGGVARNDEGLSEEAHAYKVATAGAIAGRPEEVISKLKALEAAGVEYVLLTDTGRTVESLQTFAREIMPAFAEAPAKTLRAAQS